MDVLDHLASNALDNWLLAVPAIAIAVVLGVAYALLTGDRPYPGIPIARLDGKRKFFDFGPSKQEYSDNPVEVLAKGRQMANNSAFQVRAGSGYKICVPQEFAEEVLKNTENLSFRGFLQLAARDFHADIPGFDSFRVGTGEDGIMPDMVRINLTQSLGLITNDIIDECQDAIPRWFPSSPDWTTLELKKALLDVVARLSTRVFAGKELSRNEQYLHIAKENTIDAFKGSHELHKWPQMLKYLVHWFIPECQNLRKQTREARRLLDKKADQAISEFRNGAKASKKANAFQWIIETAKDRPWSKDDLILLQLQLSLAAIHTTTELATWNIVQLCKNPEIVKPLREEVINILSEEGWTKTALYKMKLLDSFMKETHRWASSKGNSAVGRMTIKDTVLSNGTFLPAGSLVQVLHDNPMNPTLYPNPEKFDAYRFVEKGVAFATTNTDMMVFGLGKWACPGRFFASNEVKIMLAFLLLRYDFRLLNGEAPKPVFFENQVAMPADVKVQVRRRKEEIDVVRPKGGV